MGIIAPLLRFKWPVLIVVGLSLFTGYSALIYRRGYTAAESKIALELNREWQHRIDELKAAHSRELRALSTIAARESDINEIDDLPRPAIACDPGEWLHSIREAVDIANGPE